MHAIVSTTSGAGAGGGATAGRVAAFAVVDLPALGLLALAGLLGLRTFGTPSLSARRRGG
jgi:hypothetical protein